MLEDGSVAAEIAQYPNETSYPEGAGPWYGFEIDTTDIDTGIESAILDADAIVDVFTVTGVRVRAAVKAADAFENLPAGLYIAGGKKVIVK